MYVQNGFFIWYSPWPELTVWDIQWLVISLSWEFYAIGFAFCRRVFFNIWPILCICFLHGLLSMLGSCPNVYCLLPILFYICHSFKSLLGRPYHVLCKRPSLSIYMYSPLCLCMTVPVLYTSWPFQLYRICMAAIFNLCRPVLYT